MDSVRRRLFTLVPVCMANSALAFPHCLHEPSYELAVHASMSQEVCSSHRCAVRLCKCHSLCVCACICVYVCVSRLPSTSVPSLTGTTIAHSASVGDVWPVPSAPLTAPQLLDLPHLSADDVDASEDHDMLTDAVKGWFSDDLTPTS